MQSQNVLLTREWRAKLGDVGLAKVFTTQSRPVTTTLAGGTMPYLAPEALLGDGAGYPADVYSFGVVAMEIVLGEQIYSCEMRLQLAARSAKHMALSCMFSC